MSQYLHQQQLSVSTAIAGAGAAVFLFLSVLAGADVAEAQETTSLPPAFAAPHGLRPAHAPIVPEMKAALEPGDEIAVLDAVEIALTQAGDGATYVWRHDNGRLNGAIRVTHTFRDNRGRICRHLEMMLASGTYMRKREGAACRAADGAWVLEG